MDFFKSFVYNFHNVSDESFKKFAELITPKTFLKDHKIVKIGQVPVNFYILKSGIVRAFATDDKGKEYTRTIYTPIGTTGNLSSLITKEPSNLIYECLTDCEVLQCNYEDFYKLSIKHHDLSVFHYKVLERVYIREESKILDLTLLDATNRYKKLQEKIPNIDNLINQYHIASYLNITPVQLSRIRKKC